MTQAAAQSARVLGRLDVEPSALGEAGGRLDTLCEPEEMLCVPLRLPLRAFEVEGDGQVVLKYEGEQLAGSEHLVTLATCGGFVLQHGQVCALRVRKAQPRAHGDGMRRQQFLAVRHEHEIDIKGLDALLSKGADVCLARHHRLKASARVSAVRPDVDRAGAAQ